jgi:hypothetical protein
METLYQAKLSIPRSHDNPELYLLAPNKLSLMRSRPSRLTERRDPRSPRRPLP